MSDHNVNEDVKASVLLAPIVAAVIFAAVLVSLREAGLSWMMSLGISWISAGLLTFPVVLALVIAWPARSARRVVRDADITRANRDTMLAEWDADAKAERQEAMLAEWQADADAEQMAALEGWAQRRKKSG